MRPTCAVTTLDTFRTLHEHDHELAAYCATCERWAVLDLEQLIAQGMPVLPRTGRLATDRPPCDEKAR
jgi:hypothetical protein